MLMCSEVTISRIWSSVGRLTVDMVPPGVVNGRGCAARAREDVMARKGALAPKGALALKGALAPKRAARPGWTDRADARGGDAGDGAELAWRPPFGPAGLLLPW